MTVHVLQAAKRLCKRSRWRYSNLELQKILYIAHMYYMGEYDDPLVYGYFEAWQYGPVHPELYHYLKMFGAQPVSRVVFDLVESLDKTPERKTLDDAAEAFPPGSGPKLVSITHWEQGAWHRLYDPERRGILMTDSAILDEYKARWIDDG